jgi:hypothetical protein
MMISNSSWPHKLLQATMHQFMIMIGIFFNSIFIMYFDSDKNVTSLHAHVQGVKKSVFSQKIKIFFQVKIWQNFCTKNTKKGTMLKHNTSSEQKDR